MKRLLQDNIKVDVTITSCPYDNLRTYNNSSSWNFDTFKQVARGLWDVTAEGGVIVWVVGDATINGSETGTSFRQALYFMELGFKLHDTMIYEKNSSAFPAKRNGNRYTQIFEYMFVFVKGKMHECHLLADKPNKWAGHTNWGNNTQYNKEGELIPTNNIKPVPDFHYAITYGNIQSVSIRRNSVNILLYSLYNWQSTIFYRGHYLSM